MNENETRGGAPVYPGTTRYPRTACEVEAAIAGVRVPYGAPAAHGVMICAHCHRRIHRQRDGSWYHDRNASTSCRPGEGSSQRAVPVLHDPFLTPGDDEWQAGRDAAGEAS